MKKNTFLFFCAAVMMWLFGCTSSVPENQKSPKTEFLKIQLENARGSLNKMDKGDRVKVHLAYTRAMDFDNKCHEVVLSVTENKQGDDTTRKDLEHIRDAIMKNYFGSDSLSRENFLQTIDELIALKDYSHPDWIIEQMQLMDYSYMMWCKELINKNDFAFDYCRMYVANPIGYSGKKYETEILTAASSSTKSPRIFIGTGLDASGHLTGPIDSTSIYYKNGALIYTIENPRKGIYDIPAEVILPGVYGQNSRPQKFTLHYEIK